MEILNFFRKIMFAISLVLVLSPFAIGEEIPLEYQVKANYLLNFPLFVDLPPHPQGCSAFTICTMGESPMGNALKQFKNRQIRKRPLTVEAVQEPEQIGCCQILFIASSERYRLQRVLSEAHHRRILTVSDMRDFVRQGGMINLVTVNNRITFSLNQGVAAGASISFDTKLLRLANDIVN